MLKKKRNILSLKPMEIKMSIEELEIYSDLQAHLNKMPIGYPKTESGVELSLLKKLFNPEEAQIATNMNFMPEPSKSIHRRLKKTNIQLNALEKKLDMMYDKGIMMRRVMDGEKTFANIPLVVGMYEFQLGRLTPDVVKDVFQYFKEAYYEKEYNKVGIPQLRTIPIEQAITPDLSIATYDQIRSLIENSNDVIGLMDCICRNAHDMIGDPCKTTSLRKTCLTFGSAAKIFNEKGVAEFISKGEALNLIKKMEEAGLVPQPSNSQRPFVICNCCGCCCETITNQKRFEEPARFFATNYQVEINPEVCNGCETCVNKCPMDALMLTDEKCEVDLGKCIGCGVCIPSCPNHAITLKKKEKERIPPINTPATYKAIMDKKAELARVEKL